MLEKIAKIAAILGVISAVLWAVLDHMHPNPPTGGEHHNNVSYGDIHGNGNVGNNSGTVIFGSNRSTPASEKEAARQRLHDSGVEYSLDRFGNAIENHETDILALFTEAGMTLEPFDFQTFAGRAFNADVAKVLLKGDQTSGCPTDYGAGPFYTKLEGEPLAFVRQACGREVVRARLRVTLQKAQDELRQARQNDVDNEARRIRYIASCEQTLIQTWGARVSRASAHQQCLDQNRPPEALQQTRMGETISLLEKALTVLGN